MATAASIKLVPETIRSLGFAAIGVAYMGIGTALDQASRILFIQNLMDQSLMISFDGVNDHFPLATNGYLLLDVTANKTGHSQAFFVSEGTRVYAKQLALAPASGSVYVSSFYGMQD